jgi:hypothetical protein
MNCKNPYNVLFYLFIFSFAYLLGIHSAMPQYEPSHEFVTVTAKLKAVGDASPKKDEICHLDKDTEMKVISSVREGEADIVTLLCEGKYYAAGFLSSGGKYLAANQPVSPVFEDGVREGRIISIFPTEIT